MSNLFLVPEEIFVLNRRQAVLQIPLTSSNHRLDYYIHFERSIVEKSCLDGGRHHQDGLLSSSLPSTSFAVGPFQCRTGLLVKEDLDRIIFF